MTYAPPTNQLGGPIRKNADGDVTTTPQMVMAYSKNPNKSKLLEWILTFNRRADLDMFVKVVEDNSKPHRSIYGQYPMYQWMQSEPGNLALQSINDRKPAITVEVFPPNSSLSKQPNSPIRERVMSTSKEEDPRDRENRLARERLMERKRKEESLMLERRTETYANLETDKRDNILEGAWKISYQTVFVDYLQICKELSASYYSIIHDVQMKYSKEKEAGKDTTGNKGIEKGVTEKQSNMMWSDKSQWANLAWETLNAIKPGLLESAVLNIVMLCKVISEFRAMAETHVKEIIDELPLPPNYRKHIPDTDGSDEFLKDRVPTKLVYTSQFYVVTLAIPEKAHSLTADQSQKHFINDRAVGWT
jgi:hypothetical protein